MSFNIPKFKQRLNTYIGDSKATIDKDIYKFLSTKVPFSRSTNFSMLDVGCATGDLLLYFANKYPSATLSGLDIEPKLIEVAKQRKSLSSVDLLVGDGLNEIVGQFDIVTSLGTLGIFDSFEPLLENLIRNTKPGGYVFVQALLNPEDIDVKVAYKDNVNSLDWMRGFNIFSRLEIERWLKKRNIKVKFYDFSMENTIDKRPEHPHRAYTIELASGVKRTTNGLCLLLPETLMEIYVPSK